MLRCRLKILAHRHEIDVGAAHVVHHLMDLHPFLAEPKHDARLGEDRRVAALDAFEQAQRGIIARAGTDRRIEPRHGFEIVIIDVGSRIDDGGDRAFGLVAEIGGEDFDRRLRRFAAQRLNDLDELARAGVRISIVVPGAMARIARIVLTKCSAPPSGRSSRSTEVMTMWLSPIFAAAIAVCSGSSKSTGRGMPVLTLQKAQARVQVSPRIITVACFLVQHSPMFGHAASSHTVCRFSSRISLRVSA